MASRKAEIDKIVREERERTEREIARLREDSHRKIEEIRSEAESKQAEMRRHMGELEREQREARLHMEARVVESIEKQKRELQQEIVKLQKSAEERMRREAEELNKLWREAYQKLDERIRATRQMTEDILAKEREHAKRTLEAARASVAEARSDAALRRFGAHWIKWLTDMFNEAVSTYNAGFVVPADGQAQQILSESRRCRDEAHLRQSTWQLHHDDAVRLLHLREAGLAIPPGGVTIEAAECALDGVDLSTWNEEGWRRMGEQLEDVAAVLNGDSPCSLEEIAMSMVALNSLEVPISEEVHRAEARARQFLYCAYLLSAIAGLIEDEMPGWEEVEQELWKIKNEGDSLLRPFDESEEEIRIHVAGNGKNLSEVSVCVEDGSYDSADVRRRRLFRLHRLLTAHLSGDEGPAMAVGAIHEYWNGEHRCFRAEVQIPGSDFQAGGAPTQDVGGPGRKAGSTAGLGSPQEEPRSQRS